MIGDMDDLFEIGIMCVFRNVAWLWKGSLVIHHVDRISIL